MNSCLLPWVHMFYHSDGSVYPCCKLAGNEKFLVGKTSDNVNELWNSEVLKKLRVSFTKNTPCKECFNHCFAGPQPINNFLNEEILNKKNEYFAQTAFDGTFFENFIVWSINESNLCNFKCMYCNFKYSTMFYEEKANNSNKLLKSFVSLKAQLDLFKQFSKKIKVINFAAGESMLQKGYLEMIKHLYNTNNLNVEINFITNLSILNNEILELLNKFNNATVIASLDTYGERAEYIRKGTKWRDIEKNRIELLKYSNIKFMVQAVITNMNIFTLPDFHYKWYNEKLLSKDNLRYYILSSPKHYFLNVLPDKTKCLVKQKLTKYIEFLSDVNNSYANKMLPKSKIFKIIKLLDKPKETTLKTFFSKINEKDNNSNIKFKDIFTEFFI